MDNIFGPKHRSNRNVYYLDRHVDTILCCSIDNNMTMIVSGGVDDTAYVWNLQTGDVKFECKDHKDSVVSASFNLNSAQVASGDMAGYLQVRDTTTGNKIISYDLDEIRWLMWHNVSPYVLLAGTASGEFWMWHTHDSNARKTFPSFNIPTTSAKLLEDGGHILVSYEDGSMRMFNLRSQAMIHYFVNDREEPSEIFCMDYNEHNKMIALGYSNSDVKVIASHSFKLLKTLQCSTPHEQKVQIVQRQAREAEELEANKVPDPPERRSQRFSNVSADNDIPSTSEQTSQVDTSDTEVPEDDGSLEVIDEYASGEGTENPEEDDGEEDKDCDVMDLSGEDDDSISRTDSQDDNEPYDPNDLLEAVETVCFSPDGEYLLAANTIGSTYMWQVSNQNERAHVHLDTGICRALWATKTHCLIGCLDGTVRVFDANLKCLEILHPHQEQIMDICFREGLFVSASDDKRLAVFNYNPMRSIAQHAGTSSHE